MVFAAPEDDGPRAVLADWWSERGDPRGEFVALSLAKKLDEAKVLLRRHEAEWVGDLAPVTKSRAYHRGFLDSLSLKPNRNATEKTWEAATRATALGTVRRLRRDTVGEKRLIAFLASPITRNVRCIRVTSRTMLEALIASGRTWPALALEFDFEIRAEHAEALVRAPLFAGTTSIDFPSWNDPGPHRLAAARAMLRVKPQLEVVASGFYAEKHPAWYAELEAAVPGVKLTRQAPDGEDWSEHLRAIG